MRCVCERLIYTRISPQSSHTSYRWRSSTSGTCSGSAPPPSLYRGYSLGRSTSGRSCRSRLMSCYTACDTDQGEKTRAIIRYHCNKPQKHTESKTLVPSLCPNVGPNSETVGRTSAFPSSTANKRSSTMTSSPERRAAAQITHYRTKEQMKIVPRLRLQWLLATSKSSWERWLLTLLTLYHVREVRKIPAIPCRSFDLMSASMSMSLLT